MRFLFYLVSVINVHNRFEQESEAIIIKVFYIGTQKVKEFLLVVNDAQLLLTKTLLAFKFIL